MGAVIAIHGPTNGPRLNADTAKRIGTSADARPRGRRHGGPDPREPCTVLRRYASLRCNPD